MISPIAFRATQSTNTTKKSQTSTQAGIITTALGGAVLGGYGIYDYKNIKDKTNTEISVKQNLIKAEIVGNQCKIIDDCIQKSEFVNMRTEKIKTDSDLKKLGFKLEDILDESEMKDYNKKCNIINKRVDHQINYLEEYIAKLVDKFIRESDFAKEHPYAEPYTLNEVLGNNSTKTMFDVLGEEKYEVFDPIFQSKSNELKLTKLNKDLLLEQLLNDTLSNSTYNKNIPQRDSITYDVLKKEGFTYKEIFTPEEFNNCFKKCETEEKRLKEIEEKSIQALKENLKKSKTKNLGILAGGGFGIALVSLISLLTLNKNNKGTTKNAN